MGRDGGVGDGGGGMSGMGDGGVGDGGEGCMVWGMMGRDVGWFKWRW